MNISRFRNHYLLHDRGNTEDAEKLAAIMAKRVGTDNDFFKHPQPPYEFKEDASSLESYNWLRKYFLPELLPDSIVFGIGLGGLLVARLQEDFPAKNLSVVAVNSPLTEGQVAVSDRPSIGRVALYSQLYTPILNQGQAWPLYASQAYDLPWLVHGIKNAKYGLAYLMTAYMQKEDISAEIATFMDTAPEVGKGQAAV